MKKVLLVGLLILAIITLLLISSVFLYWYTIRDSINQMHLEPDVSKIISYVYTNTDSHENQVCVFNLDEITDFEWDYVIYTPNGVYYPSDDDKFESTEEIFDAHLMGLVFVHDDKIIHRIMGEPYSTFGWDVDAGEPTSYLCSKEDAIFEGRYYRTSFFSIFKPGQCVVYPHFRKSVANINSLYRGMSAEDVVDMIGKADGEQLSTISKPDAGEQIEWTYILTGKMSLHLEYIYSEKAGSFLNAAWVEEDEKLKEIFFSSSDSIGTQISWIAD